MAIKTAAGLPIGKILRDKAAQRADGKGHRRQVSPKSVPEEFHRNGPSDMRERIHAVRSVAAGRFDAGHAVRLRECNPILRQSSGIVPLWPQPEVV